MVGTVIGRGECACPSVSDTSDIHSVPVRDHPIAGRRRHHFDFANYRHRYLAEAQDRVNRRFDLASLVGRLAHTCVRTAPCPKHWLRLGDTGPTKPSSYTTYRE